MIKRILVIEDQESRSTIIANDVFPQACIGPRSTFLALILISIKDASFAPRQR
jgi:hypothetical protein